MSPLRKAENTWRSKRKNSGNHTASKLAIAAAVLTRINTILTLADKLMELFSK